MRPAQLDLDGNLPRPPAGELFAEFEITGGRLCPSVPGLRNLANGKIHFTKAWKRRPRGKRPACRMSKKTFPGLLTKWAGHGRLLVETSMMLKPSKLRKIPARACLSVMLGLHPLPSFRPSRVPESPIASEANSYVT